MKRLTVFLFFIAFSVTAAAQTPTPSFLMAGIYNQSNSEIGISGSYSTLSDSAYYLGDAYSLPYIIYSGDLATGGTVSASTQTNGAASGAFANDGTTSLWGTTVVAPPHWIEYNFGTNRTILRYTMQAATTFVTRTPGTWELQYWNVSTWVAADSRTGITWSAGEIKSFDVATANTSQRWRIYITDNSGDNANTRIAEIEMMEVTLNSPSLSFSFYGKEFSLLSETSSNGPELEICIDGICNNVSQYSSSTERGISQTFSNLPLSVHSVTISRLNSGGANAFIFDGLIISPEYDNDSSSVSVNVTLSAPPTEASRYAWEISNELGTPQAVTFDYTATAGDILVSSSLYGVLLMLVFIFVIVIWGALRWQK